MAKKFEICCTCKRFNGNADYWCVVEGSEVQGECRRNAPIPLLTPSGASHLFPVVGGDDTCGEWMDNGWNLPLSQPFARPIHSDDLEF